MKQRVITAVVALALFIPVIIYGGFAIQLTAAALAVVGVYELFKMKGLQLVSFEGILAALGAVALVLPREVWFFFLPEKSDTYILFYVLMMVLLTAAVFSKNTYTFDEAAFPVLVSLYVGMGFKSFLLARGTTADLTILMYGLLVVWSTDIGAYMIGRQLGKRKLAPAISPNKTLEGSLGGVVSAVVVAAIFFIFYPAQKYFGYEMWVMLLFTVIFSMVGQMGDLVESAFKRHYGVKDSGTILPGHGGILDRFDSMLFVFPVMHLLGIF
ncbi:phosphatidate cytidylyltransferase [uncultured Vagococcus sp.]|uniref:phosphatidate cytidylyltransferase n=1 Tax=uncultured Vagococcus sp. TaxID=189676 RepID=UPI0028D83C78|nr:phosphatidate cytidylyltransferase [uncultured Vagococcus sp.]